MHDDKTDDIARFEERRDALLKRLPARIARAASWLLAPARRWARLPMGAAFIIGGIFSFLPVLGLWMLPLGMVLLAEDIPFFRHLCARMLGWVARRHPAWLEAQPSGPRAD